MEGIFVRASIWIANADKSFDQDPPTVAIRIADVRRCCFVRALKLVFDVFLRAELFLVNAFQAPFCVCFARLLARNVNLPAVVR